MGEAIPSAGGTPTPRLSVVCITYNAAQYIRAALDGFLMQKTNFSFEVLVHDDASTDGTAEIIREYAERRPDVIRAVFQEACREGVSQHVRRAPYRDVRYTGKLLLYYPIHEDRIQTAALARAQQRGFRIIRICRQRTHCSQI